GGENGPIEVNRLSRSQDREVSLDIKRGHKRAEPKVDFVLCEPVVPVEVEFVWFGLSLLQEGLGELRPLVRRMQLIAHHRDGPFFIVLTNALACAKTGRAGSNNQIIALNHGCEPPTEEKTGVKVNGRGVTRGGRDAPANFLAVYSGIVRN